MPQTSENINYYDKFSAYLNELLQNYTRLGALLIQKLTAISKFDVISLDSIIKEEQVFVLLSRSFDSNIQSYREKLSLKGDSLSEVISEMPPEHRHAFELLHLHLKSKLDEVKGLNERCQSLIEERIYTIERSINQLDKSKTTAYGKPGTVAKPAVNPESHILKKSI